ncbi:outer membrane lipoprotein carrier protein LolA [Paraflavitalea soli]|uniref:Outer membrane lipoprotein carrier protein LolA n=1 Tax=Paraflavitalea soli TaxID=2315862 RepID=A0A3B7MXA6_9BACT|nr:outer membrane lipoprotein carrier protein LolA [Paraflavitalea soli]AXY78113.1 outer membrane lipoprotein carrier protein LolA [Paraflavitalea soli]
MKAVLLFFSTILTALVGFSQTGDKPVSSDPAAKKILDEVSAKFKTYKAVQAAFVLKNEDSKGKVLDTKKGTVSMKGSKYKVSLVGGAEIFCDGANVWTFDKSSNEVTITKLEGSASMITPTKLFTNFYDKDFLYKLNGEKKEGNKTLVEIEMTPVDKTKPFHKVFVLVDKTAKTIYSTRVLDKSGTKITYTVTTLNGKAALTDALFVFDKSKYPGVEEVDLR